MTRRIVVVATLLLFTAAFGPAAVSAEAAALSSPSPSVSTPEVAGAPASDSPVGCVDGVCHDDELGFEEPTNLTDAELDALIDRSMARVEYLRGEQFESTVDVEVRSRESFRADSALTNTSRTDSFQEWNDQVWEALFIVGENRRSADAIDSTVGAAVNGFYTPDGDRIVIISATPDAPTISERTLVHELVHAFQHQRHDLTSQPYRTDTQDAGLAVDGVVEGEAGYIEARFEERCDSGQWECLDDPLPVDSGADSSPGNQGVLLTLLQPYSDGPAYIHEVKSTEGWDGVDERVASPPETTSTIIHREPVEAATLDIEDTATDGWERYADEGVGGAETVGEASIYVMFWYQAAEYDADTVGTDSLRGTTAAYDRYNYSAAPSDGWVGDKLYPYQRGDDDGYVWTTQWESTDDVREFVDAYGAILDAHGAEETDAGTYVVSEGSFSGAYAVDVTDTRVTIVHAPTEAGLFELRPGLEPTALDGEQPLVEDDIPGFGVVVAVTALVAFLAIGRRRR